MKPKMKRPRMCLSILLLFLTCGTTVKAYEGKVVDAQTKTPIEGALITLADQMVRTEKDGGFRIEGNGDTLKLRAPGYLRRDLAASDLSAANGAVPLTPFKAK